MDGINQSLNNKSSTLDFRDSIVLCLELLPGYYTRKDFYAAYLKIYLKLKELELVSFTYPQFTQMILMFQKLARKEIIQEEFHEGKYVIILSEIGKGAFEVISAKLDLKSELHRIQNVINHLISAS